MLSLYNNYKGFKLRIIENAKNLILKLNIYYKLVSFSAKYITINKICNINYYINF